MTAVDESKRAAELSFWRDLYHSVGRDAFVEIRRNDFREYARWMPEIHDQQGLGLDLGSGPWSIFEQRGMNVMAADPLSAEYVALVNPPCDGATYVAADGEALEFPDDAFDWVFCANAIDHSPNPERMVAEVRRVLKPGGLFFFEVHFDPVLHGNLHYSLWRRDVVDAHLKAFHLRRCTEEWWALHRKYRFFGLYE